MSRLLLAVLLADNVPLPATAADPPKLDRHGDPLPPGAVARLGTDRLSIGYGWALVPPAYKTYVLPTTDGFGVYDLATGRATADGPGGKPVGGTAAVSADGARVAVVRGEGVAVYDRATGRAVLEVRPAVQPVGRFPSHLEGASLSADGSRLAVGGQSQHGRGALTVWEVGKNEPVRRLEMPHDGPAVPYLSPDGKTLATRGMYNTPLLPPAGQPGERTGPAICVWGLAGGRELYRIPVEGSGRAVAFSPDGNTLATAGGRGPIDLWAAATGKPVRTLFGRTAQGFHLAFASDGNTLAAVGRDGTVQTWSLPDGRRLRATVPAGPPVSPTGVGFAADGRVVAWGSAGTFGSAQAAWDAPSGKLLTPPPEHTGGLSGVAFGAGGREVVTAGGDGRVVRWEAATGRPLAAVAVRLPRVHPEGGPYHSDAPLGLVLSADGSATVSMVGPGGVYDLPDGGERFALPQPIPGNTTNIPSDDLARVAVLSVSSDATPSRAAVWDIPGERMLTELRLPDAAPGYAPVGAFSPDRSRFVTVTSARNRGGEEPRLVTTGWDLATGKPLGRVVEVAERGQPRVAAANNTSAVVATGRRLWGVDFAAGRKGEEIDAVDGPNGTFGPVAFAPDGTRFAAGVTPGMTVMGVEDRHEVRVYGWPHGKLLHTFAGHSAPISALRFSPDGKWLLSGSMDSTAILWDLSAVPAGK